jgi:sialate O-acetylesterase
LGIGDRKISRAMFFGPHDDRFLAGRGFRVALLGLFLATGSLGAFEVAGVFGDNMVIARDQPAAIWGWGSTGEEIRISFIPDDGSDSVGVTTRTGEDGRWKAELPPQKGGMKGTLEIKSSSKGFRRISNVAFGEVWFCAGQSNMYLQMFQVLGGKGAIAAADDPDLRLAWTRGSSAVPLDQLAIKWAPCAPRTLNNFSAVAYFFGRMMREELGVPVGLIQSAYNGTPIQAWMPLELLEQLPESKGLAEAHRRKIASMGVKPDPAVVQALPKGEQSKVPGGAHSPAGLYNAMVHPFVGYPISGFLWYQGESNVHEAPAYRVLFPAFITELRKRWNRGDLPFLYVELAGFRARQSAPVEENSWSELREAQGAALVLAKTKVATAIDVGDETDIHPRDKRTVGERLALAALWQMSDGEKGALSPRFERAEFTGRKVTIYVSHAGEGLKTKDGSVPARFAVRDDSGAWKNIAPQLEGNKIVLEAGEGSEPREVRYAWAMNPSGLNVVNSAGLPLSPFRVAHP